MTVAFCPFFLSTGDRASMMAKDISESEGALGLGCWGWLGVFYTEHRPGYFLGGDGGYKATLPFTQVVCAGSSRAWRPPAACC